MAGIVLYIPGVAAANPEHLRRVGLGALADEPGAEFCDVLRGGPDGGHGVAVGWRTGDAQHDPRIGVFPEQSWTPAKADVERQLDAGRFWIGVDPARPVHPADLAKKKMFTSHTVMLADGNPWRIPVAARLPHKLGLNDEGRFSRQVLDAFRTFYERSEKYALHIFTELDQVEVLKSVRPELADQEVIAEIVLEDAWTFCCEALAINYRLTPELVDYLELLNDSCMIGMIMAVIDLPEINAVRDQKKSYCPVGIPVG